MHEAWKLQDAKNRFSELVQQAIARGPQIVTRRGKETVIVMSMDDYKKLAPRDTSLSRFFRSAPVDGEDLDLTRSKDAPREVEL